MMNRPSGDTHVLPPDSLQSGTDHGIDDTPPDSLQSGTDHAGRRCQECHRPAVSNRRRCHVCLAKEQAAYWQRVKDGICTRCKRAPAQVGHRRCEACAEKTRQESASRYIRTKQHGVCTYCRHHQAMPHREVCFPCFKKIGGLVRARKHHQQQQWISWLLVVALWTGALQIQKQARRSA